MFILYKEICFQNPPLYGLGHLTIPPTPQRGGEIKTASNLKFTGRNRGQRGRQCPT